MATYCLNNKPDNPSVFDFVRDDEVIGKYYATSQTCELNQMNYKISVIRWFNNNNMPGVKVVATGSALEATVEGAVAVVEAATPESAPVESPECASFFSGLPQNAGDAAKVSEPPQGSSDAPERKISALEATILEKDLEIERLKLALEKAKEKTVDEVPGVKAVVPRQAEETGKGAVVRGFSAHRHPKYPDAPPLDPALGDKTPAFVQWLRDNTSNK